MVDYNNTQEMEAALSSLRRAVKDSLPSYDEYGMGTSKNAVDDIILGNFYDYDNWDSDKDRLPAVKVSDYGLYTLAYEIFNDDFICINPDGTVDVENSNHKDVAKIIANLVPQETLAKVRENILGESKTYDIAHVTAIVEGKVRSQLMEYSFDPWHCDMHDWPLVNTNEDNFYDTLWKVCIWSGSGYVLSVFRAWGRSEEDAIEEVVAWLEDNEPSLLQDDAVNRIREELAAEGKDEDEIWNEIDQRYLYVDPGHYIYLENLRIEKFPKEYVQEYGYEPTDGVNEATIPGAEHNSFYSEEDYDGNTGKPGMVRSYDIGWNNSVSSFQQSAQEENMTLEQFLEYWWNEVSNGTPWTWQKLGSGYGFHGDTILQLGNVRFKDIHGQLMIDESEPKADIQTEAAGMLQLEKDTLHFTVDDPSDIDRLLTDIENEIIDVPQQGLLSINTIVPGKEYEITGIESDEVWEEVASRLDLYDEVDVLESTPVTEAKLNELSTSTEGWAIKHAAYADRERQMKSMAGNTIDKYNRQYAFEDGGYSFKITREMYDGVPKFIICAASSHDRQDCHYIDAQNGNPVAFGSNHYDFWNSNVGYVVKNLKAGPRQKFREMLKAIETLNNPRIGESIRRITESIIKDLVK